jgi:TPR repeat protein
MRRIPFAFAALAAALVAWAVGTDAPADATAEGDMSAANAPAWLVRAGATALCSADVGLGCHELGEIHRLGWGVKPDAKTATGYYTLACDKTYGPGCYSEGLAYRSGDGVKKDEKRARTAFNKACKLGVAAGCAAGK